MKTVSIIMGIYNCEKTVGCAIQSIVDQTYTNWEMILCDDGSTDNTFHVATVYRELYPDQIILMRNDINQGLNATLNKCLALAKGDYIARQDGDDESMPNRLEKEVAALEQHPEFSIVSSDMILFDECGEWGASKSIEYPQKNDFVAGTPFAHAPCLVRRDAIVSVGGYSVDKRLLRVEDYHLWYKMYLKGYSGVNIQEPLYRCRDDRDAQKRRTLRNRINECYIRWLIYRDFQLSIKHLPQIIRPLLVAFLPNRLYAHLHRQKMQM